LALSAPPARGADTGNLPGERHTIQEKGEMPTGKVGASAWPVW
jgi:hypothetical protein